ncbi:hypothetical protein AAFF_G00286960 [Aldrovandia affinis]|uniref:Uncharacterized protein n=1 Tax=Aldrovandia affinis TaxID=143900 RepID=A0AAD7TAR7_9TELE|nr:hypothetical protein AAFF_G00286960 [Aldrovandia affinis]
MAGMKEQQFTEEKPLLPEQRAGQDPDMDYITNNIVLEKAQMPSMESILLLRQLHWAGHVSCMENTRMPKAVLYSELCQGKHNRSGPIKCFKVQLKQQFTGPGIDTKTWELRAADKNSWRSTAKKASLRFDSIIHGEKGVKKRHSPCPIPYPGLYQP